MKVKNKKLAIIIILIILIFSLSIIAYIKREKTIMTS